MPRWPALVFFALPALEIISLVMVATSVGFWGTLGLLLLDGMLGAHLIHRGGLAALARLDLSQTKGLLPPRDVLDALVLPLAGILLIIPGFCSDLLAGLMLWPLARDALYRFFEQDSRFSSGNPEASHKADVQRIIDVDYEIIEEKSDGVSKGDGHGR